MIKKLLHYRRLLKLMGLRDLLQNDRALVNYLLETDDRNSHQAVLLSYSDDYHRINVLNEDQILFSIQCRNGNLLVCPAICSLAGDSIGSSIYQDAIGLADAVQSYCGAGLTYIETDFHGTPVIYLAVPIEWRNANRAGLHDIFGLLVQSKNKITLAMSTYIEHVRNFRALVEEGVGSDGPGDPDEEEIDER